MSKYGVISGPNSGKYGPEITPYLDTFHGVYDKTKKQTHLKFFLSKQIIDELIFSNFMTDFQQITTKKFFSRICNNLFQETSSFKLNDNIY